ncbi:AAA domain-containing protein [Mucilaginibacter pedocola]|uniref:DNA helicase n=1 Tax=Mucilaginibacter pedocola TaxID=1792845 RepID=A0A1S9PL78_9SPHI|nr:AAA domain-containing protein [Mucilaginibacter pedocola]OOQ61695.1 DNA helicase [Mucilaginibacter pedocola]
MDYFKNLLQLLKTERDDDREAYLKLTQSTSVTDRRAAGITWYPIAIRSSEPSRGDYLTVELERTTHKDIAHQFRFGAPAVLFSNHNAGTDRVEGTIAYQGGDRLKITLFTEELPDWSRDGKLGVELLFDNNSYDEMQEALKQADAIIEKTEGKLVRVLTEQAEATFLPDVIKLPNNKLNPSQSAAVQQILAANELAIVHGPPGTGKTTTIVQAIKSLIKQNGKQVLVVAPSNTAVDLLSEKLAAEGLNVLRIGNPAGVSEKLNGLTLDSKMATHQYMKDAKQLKKQAAGFKNMAHQYKRSFGKRERDQRKALFDEAHRIMKEVAKIEQFVIDDLAEKAQVITATLVGCNHYTVRDKKYHTVVIDEAGQALEPACWIPILKAEKLIMAGDHFQLPPTIKSETAARNGLSTTLLEKCAITHTTAVTLLEEQYRMNEAIMGFSSAEFYGNRLIANASVAKRLLFEGDTPMSFVDAAGCGFDEKPEGTSSINPDEAAFLFKHLDNLAGQIAASSIPFPSIAIISPYKSQVRLLQELFEASPLVEHKANISINTIDSFQGQERDVVYISMVRSNNEGTIGFLSDTRRMNVAMTRARKKLVIIGDSATITRLPFYADMLKYAEDIGGYKSAWEYMN